MHEFLFWLATTLNLGLVAVIVLRRSWKCMPILASLQLFLFIEGPFGISLRSVSDSLYASFWYAQEPLNCFIDIVCASCCFANAIKMRGVLYLPAGSLIMLTALYKLASHANFPNIFFFHPTIWYYEQIIANDLSTLFLMFALYNHQRNTKLKEIHYVDNAYSTARTGTN